MNWGTGIFITFVVFMGIIISMVVISMRQDISLVAPDYYKQEIAYQDQIDKLQNAENAGEEITFEYFSSEYQFVVSSKNPTSGEAHFYRPSDASKDIQVLFEIVGSEQKTISTKGMEKGLWKVKLTWGKGDMIYYKEKTIVI